MAGQDVNINMTVQEARAFQAWRNFNNQVDAGKKKTDELGDSLSNAGKKGDKALGDIAAGIGKAAAQFLGVGSAIATIYTTARLVMDEAERMRLAHSTADERKRLALPAYGDAMRNAADGYLETPAAQAMTRRIMQARGSANPADTFYLIGSMMSSRRDMPKDEVMNAALEVARYAGVRHMTGESAKYLGGSVLDQANTERDLGRTPNYKEILGKFEFGAGMSRSDNMQDFSTHAMKAIQQLQRLYDFPVGDAIALQGAISTAMPDLHERRSATQNMLTVKDMHHAVNALHSKGAIQTSLDEFNKMTTAQKFAWFGDKNNRDSKLARAHLFGVDTPDVDMRKQIAHGAWTWAGISDSGSLQGEAGGREVATALLDPNSGVQKQFLKNKAEYDAMEGRFAPYYDDQVSGRLGSPSSRYAADIVAKQGAQAVSDWENPSAKAGAAQKFADDIQLKTGRGALQTRVMDTLRLWRMRDPSQATTDAESIRIAEEGIEAMYQRPMDRRQYAGEPFRAWKRKRREAGTLPETQTQMRRAFADDELLDSEEKSTIQALRDYIEQLKKIQERSGPAPTDSSMLELKQSIDTLIGAMANGQSIQVTVVDQAGRELGRATSGPRALEQFHDVPRESNIS